MKLIRKELEKTGRGSLTIKLEEVEDLWHAYHLIAHGDYVRATTLRKVQKQTTTGSVANERKRLTLTVHVLRVDFDPASSVLRVLGKNRTESPYIKLNQTHTLELELNRAVTIIKHDWDTVALQRVETACDAAARSDVAAVVMHEGLAHVCLLTPSMSVTRAKIELSVPRKRKGGPSSHDKAVTRFFDNVMQAIVTKLNFDVVKVVIVASPGFLQEAFCKHLFEEAVRHDVKVLLDNRSKFIQAHSSSGHKHALKEVLTDKALQTRLCDTRASAEMRALDDFYVMLRSEPDRACYGWDHVNVAHGASAIATLLITDELFRVAHVRRRKMYVQLVEEVRSLGGEVHIFSTMHVSGEQLAKVTGIAAILRFGMPELDDVDSEDDTPTPRAEAGVQGGATDDEDNDSGVDDESDEFLDHGVESTPETSEDHEND